MTIQLDPTDVQIINALMEDGRISVAEISRRISNESKRTIHYRIEKLIKSDVIRIGTIVDPRAIGYYVRADIFIQVETGRIQEVAEKLAEFKQVSYVACLLGIYDIIITVSMRDNTELYTFIANEVAKVSGIKETATYLVPMFLKDVHHWFQHGIETEKNYAPASRQYQLQSPQINKYKVDRVDQAIVDLLMKDGRIPAAEIARQLGYISERSVRDRIESLFANKVIQICAIVNPIKLGFLVTANIILDIATGDVLETAQKLAQLDETCYVGFSIGKPSLSIQVYARDTNSLYTFVTETLHQMPGVTNTVTTILPLTLKSLDSWGIPDSACVDNVEEIEEKNLY